MPRDRLNQEKHQQNDGVGAAVGNFFKNIPGIKQIRKAIGQHADAEANQNIYTMQSNGAYLGAPALTGIDGGAQLQNTHVNFNNPATNATERINGFKLDAQPGKPTIVYFGGSEFDRSSPHYQTAMKQMAEQARKNGMGFVVCDYPTNASEAVIKDHVDQLTASLEQQGIPKNQQAYAGYSLGGFPAMYAAKQNPEAAGLHLTSTFSSVRQATKEGINEELGAAGQLVPKTELTQIMDNVALADDITQQQTARQGLNQGVMPVSMVSSKGEAFGNANNRHMTPLTNRFNNYPDRANKFAAANPSNNASHESMCTSISNQDSFTAFTAKVNAYQQTRGLGVQQNQVVAPQVQQNQVLAPPVQVANNNGPVVNRPRANSMVGDAPKTGPSVRRALSEGNLATTTGKSTAKENSVGKNIKRSTSVATGSGGPGLK